MSAVAAQTALNVTNVLPLPEGEGGGRGPRERTCEERLRCGTL